MKFVVRLLLLVAGLVFTLSLLVVMLVLLVLWGLRALWYKLTGKPILPFAMRMNPRAGFEQVFRPASSTQQQRRKLEDVTDVEPKR
jgi:hypothetical protein